MNIAILGASGHISKCIYWALSDSKDNFFYLFTRNVKNLKNNLVLTKNSNFHLVDNYNDFYNYNYDLIFNGTGFWDGLDSSKRQIFELTEKFDSLIIDYQIAHKRSISIHISSGAVYAGKFNMPVEDETQNSFLVNNLSLGDFYSIAKLNSEAKHRSHSDLKIIDLRLFGFFSRFINLKYNYYLTALITCIIKNTPFICVGQNFWRDYLHLDDLRSLLNKINCDLEMNEAIDITSREPVSRDQVIEFFKQRFNLTVEYKDYDNKLISATGNKKFYYSKRKNILYTPSFCSLETIAKESSFILGEL